MSAAILTDVLIIGAGPAGCSAALFLAKQGVSSVIIDKAVFPRDKICGDALSGKVVEVLKKLDAPLVAEIAGNETFLGSWGVKFYAPNRNSLRVPFSTNGTRTIAPGFISKRIDFDNWLYTKVKATGKVQIFESTEIREYNRRDDRIEAVSKAGAVFSAKLIIACDGAYSTFAKDFVGIKTEPAHNCFGLRAYYKNVAGLDHENFIELHFLKEILPGYFWIFPLPNGTANIGIGMRADKMARAKINLKKAFEEVVSSAQFNERFAGATIVDSIKLFGLPLGSKKRKISGDNFMLCGDAAQLIDPFTGEGIGNAMMSGMYAATQALKCNTANNYTAGFMQQYDIELYHRLWPELLLSYRMQQLVNYPSLFNFVVNKANSNKVLSETISCMFEDLDMRARLKSPSFYFNLLFS